MIAAVLTSPSSFELHKVPVPEIKSNEVKIRVEGCGICASSLPVWEGREWFNYPLQPGSPGHEGWGKVEAVGDQVRKVAIGDSVSFLSNNAYAEYDIADESSIIKLPEQFASIPFPGEPLGCAINIFERSNIQKNDVVAIIGIGFLGALLCQLAKNTGATVIAISKREYSLEFAKKFGADEVVPLTATWEVANKVADITNYTFCTKVIDATGKQEAIDLATEIICERGHFIIAGYHQDGLRQVNLQKWNWKGIDVINAHERDPEKYITGIEKAVQAVSNGIITPNLLYSDILPLDQIQKAFELTADRPAGFMKALVHL